MFHALQWLQENQFACDIYHMGEFPEEEFLNSALALWMAWLS
jgi:hypothetical protein